MMNSRTFCVFKRLLLVCICLLAPLLARAQMAGFSEHTLLSAGVERNYLLYVPEVQGNSELPLVFSFHGSGGVPQNQVDTSRFDALADQHGFIAVFPAGAFTNTNSARSWNANLEPGVDDVQFVRDMIEHIAGLTPVDRSRIYVSGFSGGGRISSRLACELSDVLAAAAPVAGLQYPDDCTPKRPIPLIAFHALDDAVNPYVLGDAARPYWRMGVETALDKWRQANGCPLANDDDKLSQLVTLYRWTACANGAELQFYHTTTGGHTWPGASQDGAIQDISASERIWEFFSHHALGE
jgi:polyhydroxybutyrate depolymerase